MSEDKEFHVDASNDLFPPPPPCTKVIDSAPQKGTRRKKKARQKPLKRQETILPAQANTSQSLSVKLRSALQDKRSARSGETLRKARTAADAAGLDFRRGEGLEDIVRRLGLEDILASPAMQALQSNPATSRKISQLNENDLTHALKMLKVKC